MAQATADAFSIGKTYGVRCYRLLAHELNPETSTTTKSPDVTRHEFM